MTWNLKIENANSCLPGLLFTSFTISGVICKCYLTETIAGFSCHYIIYRSMIGDFMIKDYFLVLHRTFNGLDCVFEKLILAWLPRKIEAFGLSGLR